MMRRTFFATTGFCAAALVGVITAKLTPVIGPWVELRAAPITAEQHIPPTSIVGLDDGRLCWKRWTTKLREAEPWNFNVFLDRPWSGDRSFPEVKDRWDGHSWHTKGSIRAGEHREQDQCVELPPDLARGEPIVLSQIIHYPGFHGWWDLPVPLPVVAYQAPGVPAHDFAQPPPPDEARPTP